MPIIRDFVYQDDEDTGLIGLMPRWMPNANTTYAVAHDILEHFMPNGLTAGEDELEALGALLALRIENGVFNFAAPLPKPGAARRLHLGRGADSARDQPSAGDVAQGTGRPTPWRAV